MKKKFLALMLALAMITSLLSSAQAVSGTTSENQATVLAVDVAEKKITDALSVFYAIDNVVSSLEDYTTEAGTFSATIHTSVDMTLLADSPEDLPAVQGLLAAVGLDAVTMSADNNGTMTLMTDNVKMAQLSMANPSRSGNEITVATRILNDQLAEVRSYIGEQQNINYYTKVSGTIENGLVTVTEVLAEDGTGGYCSLNSVLPEAPERIYNSYKSAMWPTVEAQVAQTAKTSTIALASSKYDRLAARDYARKWVYGFGKKAGEPTNVLCSVCGKSSSDCSGYSAQTYYNSSAYSIYDHNDCANFASQALAAGGMDATGSTWKKDSTTWIRATELRNYLRDNGYLTDAGYSMAAAGGLIFCKKTAKGNPYHVEVIVANDTVTRQFCAHTHDRYNAAVANNTNWEYYNINY